MRKTWKKLTVYAIVVAMLLASLPAVPQKVQAASTADITTPENPAYFTDLTSEEIIKEMGMGINLGNTLEGHSNYMPGETMWNSVITNKGIVKCMHDLGFNTLRVPVTWGHMINEDYSIDEMWMGRVQDVVDYAIAENMYVILNIHHDGAPDTGGWLNIGGTEEEFAVVKEKFDGVWKTIAERFKNYDEHLIFESMNEVYEEGYGWTEDVDIINRELGRMNALNQSFVDTVRATGSNNAKRWLSVPTKNTQIPTMIEDKYNFAVPTDSMKRVMVAGHDYNGWNPNSLDDTVYGTWAYEFKKLKEKYVDNGIPVVIGEYGSLNGTVSMNLCQGVSYLLKKNHLIGCLWDVDSVDCLIDRVNKTTRYKELTDALMRGYFDAKEESEVAYGYEAQIQALTAFDVSETEVSMEVNSKKEVTVSNCAPEENNDVILWKSDTPEVASVYNGLITARAVGTATITAFAQSGEFLKEISVTVTPKTLETPSTGITTDADSYTVEQGKGSFINGMAEPAGNQAGVTYSSADESIAAVSTMGRIVGVKCGITTITATTTDGVTKEIPVEVIEQKVSDSLDSTLAIHVLYNDSKLGYMATEIGSGMARATGDGKYTVSFDCATDLSEEAIAAGVASLDKFGSLYIRDYDVTMGTKRQSTTKEGKIVYHSLKVNDIELLTADTIEYDAVKDGIIDTGNPLNVWDGSIISTGLVEDKKNWCLSFETIENPTKIEVTFSLIGFTPKAPQETVQPTQQPQQTDINQPSGTTTPPAIIPSENPVGTPVPEKTNEVTLLKAKSKKVIVKKGKEKKIVFTVNTENGAKPAAKKIKASVSKKKVIKIKKIQVAKKRVTVSVKGLKKGKKTVLKLSCGKKSAKTTIVVK